MIRTCLLVVASSIAIVVVTSARAQDATAAPPPAEAEQPKEPNYAEVATDARKIADEIETRLIEANMDHAKGFLMESNAVQGHPPADTAYQEMQKMIKFCNSTGGKAGNCPFKLDISMSLNPGNTIGQLGRGMKPGVGLSGPLGQGATGIAGSQSRFALYGPRPFGDKTHASRRPGDVKTEARAQRELRQDPLAGNVDDLSSAKRSDADFTAETEGRVLEEYRPLIEAYFKRLAVEKP